MVQRYETLSRRTIRLSPNTYVTILAQATTFTVLVVVLHHFFEIFPCFHYQTVLITDAKVIYYIGTAIRANGDLRIGTTHTMTMVISLREMTDRI